MDTITHIALGACIGEAVFFKQAGKKALVAGAIAQSLPDIDVIAALWLPPAANLLAHRGVTHSFLFGVAAAALLAVVLRKAYRSMNVPFAALFLFSCLQLWLHDLLDTCNAYGTGLFEPFSHTRFSCHLLFVGDPFFSVSIVVAFAALVILKKNNRQRKWWVPAGLVPAFLYLLFAVSNKAAVHRQAERSLLARHITYKSQIITPTPFNIFLWYIVAATDSGYVAGYRSVFDTDSLLTSFRYYPKNEQLLRPLEKTATVKQLLRFADGYYTVDNSGDTLAFNVLRFGQTFGWQNNTNARFVFQYFLNPSYNNTLVVQRGRFKGWNRKTITEMYVRIKGK